jgi:hypothetical protein
MSSSRFMATDTTNTSTPTSVDLDNFQIMLSEYNSLIKSSSSHIDKIKDIKDKLDKNFKRMKELITIMKSIQISSASIEYIEDSYNDMESIMKRTLCQ